MYLIGGGGNKGGQSRHGTVSVTFCRLWRVINPHKIRRQTVCLLFSCQLVYLRSPDCCVLTSNKVNGHNYVVDCCAEIATKYIDLECGQWILKFVKCAIGGFSGTPAFGRTVSTLCLTIIRPVFGRPFRLHTTLQHFRQCKLTFWRLTTPKLAVPHR